VREGQSRTWADIDAVAIGHDLARGTAAFRRTGRAEGTTGTAGTTGETPASSLRPEPNWEAPMDDSSTMDAPAEQQQSQPALVT
jgi:single-strand DNA-binding protein